MALDLAPQSGPDYGLLLQQVSGLMGVDVPQCITSLINLYVDLVIVHP